MEVDMNNAASFDCKLHLNFIFFNKVQLTSDLQLRLDQELLTLALECHCPTRFPSIFVLPMADYLDYVCSVNQKLKDTH